MQGLVLEELEVAVSGVRADEAEGLLPEVVKPPDEDIERGGMFVVVVGKASGVDSGVEFDEFALVALPTKLALIESEDRTLRTELVAVKVPVVMFGTVPARLIVNVVVRP